MTYNTAVRLAVQCIEAELKRLAVNANLAEMCGATSPACVAAAKRRRELRQAIEAFGQKVLV